MTGNKMQGRTAIITGGGSGIGAACARLLASNKVRVIVVDYDGDAALRVSGEIGNEAMHVVLDVSDVDGIRRMFDCFDEQGVLANILVNSAGIREILPPLELNSEDWDRVIDVNLKGTFFMCQSFTRQLRTVKECGVIVNVASTSSILAAKNRTAYGASKHGVVGLTKQLAFEFGELGIRVNAVAPGVVRTALTESYFQDPERIARLVNAYPLGRVAMPEDIADVVLFLVSNAARFITGAILPVDGGYTTGKSW